MKLDPDFLIKRLEYIAANGPPPGFPGFTDAEIQVFLWTNSKNIPIRETRFANVGCRCYNCRIIRANRRRYREATKNGKPLNLNNLCDKTKTKEFYHQITKEEALGILNEIGRPLKRPRRPPL